MSNAIWLSKVTGDPKLYNMVIPGSHDAGVYGDSLVTRKATAAWSRCQGSNIYNQALSGSRMFDCRVFVKYSKEQKQIVPTMGHFSREKAKHGKHGSRGSMGAYGGTLLTAVQDAIAYVRTYPSEFLILRFSHTYHPNETAAVLDQLRNTGANGNYIFTDAARSTNVAKCRLSQLRGKVVMVFASEFHTNFDPANGYLPFYKYANGTAVASGLATCGTYTSTKDMKEVHSNAFTAADEHKNHPHNDHLHFVYWQQTVGLDNIRKKTQEARKVGKDGKVKDYTGGAHANLGTFLREIQDNMNVGFWKLPNVISHDFVSADTCRQIFALNPGCG